MHSPALKKKTGIQYKFWNSVNVPDPIKNKKSVEWLDQRDKETDNITYQGIR